MKKEIRPLQEIVKGLTEGGQLASVAELKKAAADLENTQRALWDLRAAAMNVIEAYANMKYELFVLDPKKVSPAPYENLSSAIGKLHISVNRKHINAGKSGEPLRVVDKKIVAAFKSYAAGVNAAADDLRNADHAGGLEPISGEPLFYLYSHRKTTGDLRIFHRPFRCGYTPDLRQAGRFDELEAIDAGAFFVQNEAELDDYLRHESPYRSAAIPIDRVNDLLGISIECVQY